MIEDNKDAEATRQVIIGLVADDIMDTIGDTLRADAKEIVESDPELDESDIEFMAYSLAEEVALEQLNELFGNYKGGLS